MQDNKNSKKTDGVQASFFTWEYDVPVKETVKEESEEKHEAVVSDKVVEPVIVDTHFSQEITEAEIIELPIEQSAQTDQKQNGNCETVQESYSEPNGNSNDSASSSDYPENTDAINAKRYTKSGDFSRLAIVFNDRKLQYYLYVALFFIASVSAATLMFKFEESGIFTVKKLALDYFNYGITLKSDLLGSMLFAAPFIAGSLIVYFGGYTIFAKFISSIWMACAGFFWSFFTVSAYSKFDNVSTFIIFGVLSALMMLNNIIFSAEAGKYSALNLYGKSELTKFENVKQFSIIYLGYCIFSCGISYLILKFVI